MIKNIVLQHREEMQFLQSKPVVARELLDFAEKIVDSDLVKVITGPRRAGKSTFALDLLKGKNVAYLNFDDAALLKISDTDEIIKGINEVYPDPDYILFDEIQNLPGWELFVNKLHRRGANLVLTGSNSNLLGRELATALTGRHIPLEIYPFSFREILKAEGFDPGGVELPERRGKLLGLLNGYLTGGGFPEIVTGQIDAKIYLDPLFEAIVMRDVVTRHRVRFQRKLGELGHYVVSNFGSEFSLRKLASSLEFNSVNTLSNYLGYLEEAYLVFTLNRFSFKVKEQVRAPKKVYLVDNGFVAARSFRFSPNYGRLMEYLVFLELLKRRFRANENVFTHKTRNQREVDFVIRAGTEVVQLIQVCYEPSEPGRREREYKALVEAGGELKCDNLVVLSWDEEGSEQYKGKEIRSIPLWKWLIEENNQLQ